MVWRDRCGSDCVSGHSCPPLTCRSPHYHHRQRVRTMSLRSTPRSRPRHNPRHRRPHRSRRRNRTSPNRRPHLVAEARRKSSSTSLPSDYSAAPGGELVGMCTPPSAMRRRTQQLLNLTQKVQDVLHVTKLYTVFDIKDDEFNRCKVLRLFLAQVSIRRSASPARNPLHSSAARSLLFARLEILWSGALLARCLALAVDFVSDSAAESPCPESALASPVSPSPQLQFPRNLMSHAKQAVDMHEKEIRQISAMRPALCRGVDPACLGSYGELGYRRTSCPNLRGS